MALSSDKMGYVFSKPINYQYYSPYKNKNSAGYPFSALISCQYLLMSC